MHTYVHSMYVCIMLTSRMHVFDWWAVDRGRLADVDLVVAVAVAVAVVVVLVVMVVLAAISSSGAGYIATHSVSRMSELEIAMSALAATELTMATTAMEADESW